MEVVCRGLAQPVLNYSDFKQFCESLRLLLFVGGSAAIVANLLFFHPTRSAYWRLFSPFRWPALLLSRFSGPKGSQGVFDFEQEGCSKDSYGSVKTVAYRAFERAMM